MTAQNVAIRLESVSKCYSKLDEQAMLLRSILPFWRPTRSELWALRNVDLSIARGETVGVIGRNGAGKTTLLRLLAGVTRPSTGRILTAGRIAPLISVGVGFHPEMSGRENVYVNGMLLGLTRRQVASRFDAIVDFAELSGFIDTPVKFYSSGMFMRLGFAVAAHSDPDILLVDEILAVGDFAFQRKCFEHMRGLQDGGTTIVVVSHAIHQIRALCSRTIVMSGGAVAFDGDTNRAIARQHELHTTRSSGLHELHAAVMVISREIKGPHTSASHVQPDDPVTLRLRLRFSRPVRSPQFLLRVVADDGTQVYERRTITPEWRDFGKGDEVDVEIPFYQRLGGNVYRFLVDVLDHASKEYLFHDVDGAVLFIPRRPGTVAIVDLGAEIYVDGHRVSDWPSDASRSTSPEHR